LLAWRVIGSADKLRDEAKGLEGAERAEKFAEAGEKYAEALRIKPDQHEAFYNWGAALISEAKGLEEESRARKFTEAQEKLELAKEHSGKHSFNLACLFALQGRISLALDELDGCLLDGELPDQNHLERDDDLGGVDKRDSHRAAGMIQAGICDGDLLGTRSNDGRGVGVL
jgi:tetratricopeptide (TPR) repeat protein